MRVREATAADLAAVVELDAACLPKDQHITRRYARGALVVGAVGDPAAYLIARGDMILRMGSGRAARGTGAIRSLVRAAVRRGATRSYVATWNTRSMRVLVLSGFIPRKPPVGTDPTRWTWLEHRSLRS